jgi:hypothetical protein
VVQPGAAPWQLWAIDPTLRGEPAASPPAPGIALEPIRSSAPEGRVSSLGAKTQESRPITWTGGPLWRIPAGYLGRTVTGSVLTLPTMLVPNASAVSNLPALDQTPVQFGPDVGQVTRLGVLFSLHRAVRGAGKGKPWPKTEAVERAVVAAFSQDSAALRL